MRIQIAQAGKIVFFVSDTSCSETCMALFQLNAAHFCMGFFHYSTRSGFVNHIETYFAVSGPFSTAVLENLRPQTVCAQLTVFS